MAGNTIKGSEGVKQLTDLYAALAAQIDLATQETNEFLSTTQKLPSQFIKSLEKQKTTLSGVSKGLDELTEKQKKVTAEQEESIRVAKEQLKADVRLTQATGKKAKGLQKTRFELQKTRKEEKLNIEASSALTGAYRKQTIRLNRLTARLKDFAVTGRLASKEGQRLTRRVEVLGGRIKKAEVAAGQFGRNVGNYPKTMKLAASAVRSLASAMGLVGGAFLFVRVMRDAFNTVVKFNRQLIAVQKTTDLSSTDIKLFRDEVIKLGLAMKGVSIQGLLNSSEVAGQLGIKGRDNILGFAKAIELLKVSAKGIGEQAVVDFAKFIEVSKDSAENADRLASVITDLGNNFSTTEKEIISSAIEIQKGAQLYNVSAEAVLGLAAASSSLGVQDQAARTSIRKTLGVIQQSIFTGKNLNEVLKLTNLTEKELSEQFEKDASQVFIKFLKGLKDINDSGGNTSGILKEMKLSGDRVAPTILSLAEKHERTARAVNSASEEYINNIALQREADLAAGSLSSQIGDLADNWDGFILSVESGDGPLSKFLVTSIKVLNTVIALNRILLTLNPEREKQNRIIDASFESTKKLLEAQERSLPVLQSVLKTEEKRLAFLRTQEKFNKLSEDELKLNFKKQLQTIGTIRALREVISATKIETNAIEKQKETIIDQLLVLDKSLKRMNLEKMTLSELKSRLIALTEARKKSNDEREKEVTILDHFADTLKKLKDIEKGALKFDKLIGKDALKGLQKDLQDQIDNIILTPPSLEGGATALFDEDEFRLLEEQFAKLGDLYQIDASRFSALFDDKENTINDYVAAASEATIGLYNLFQENYDSDLIAARRSADLALQFVGDNTAAREEILDQLDEKETEIRNRQAKADRDAAIFRIIIDTARGVVAALTSIPPNVPLSIAIGAIGAASLAKVLSTEVPQFKEGIRNFVGGPAVLGDGGVSEYAVLPNKEVIKTPAHATLYNLPPGTDVLKNEDEFTRELQRELDFNGILSSVDRFGSTRTNRNALTKNDFNSGIKRLQKTIDSGDRSEIIIDERGLNKYVVRNHARIKILNNRFVGRGRKV